MPGLQLIFTFATIAYWMRRRSMPTRVESGIRLSEWTTAPKCTPHRARPKARAFEAQQRAKKAKSKPDRRVINAVMDSGCTFHCHPHRGDFINFRSIRDEIFGIDGKGCAILGIGDLPVVCRDKKGNLQHLLIKGVRYAPEFTDTLFSVEQFWQTSRVEVRFGSHRDVLLPDDSEAPGIGLPFVHRDGLFIWDIAPLSAASAHARALATGLHRPKSSSHVASLPADDAAKLMHRRLHCSASTLRSLGEKCSDAPAVLRGAADHPCPHCAEANSVRQPHPGHAYQPSHPGRLVHADIAGPFVRSHRGSARYLLVLVDDHSRLKLAYPMRSKDEAISYVRRFVASLNALCSRGKDEPVQVVGTLHRDNAGEFISREFREFLDDEAIASSTCPPHVHSLNGVAERAIRSIMELVRSNLVASQCPASFWPYLVDHALDVLNRTTGAPGQPLSSFELVTGEKPKVMSIMPFGCAAFVVKPRSAISKTQLDSKAWPGINLGRDPERPGSYLVYLPEDRRVLTSSDVLFDEHLYPWRPAGDRRVDGPSLTPSGDSDSGLFSQPPTPSPTSKPSPPSSLPEAYRRASRQRSPSGANHALVLFSGDYNRPDGLGAFLEQLGVSRTLVDNDPAKGAVGDDITDDAFYTSLQQRIVAGEFNVIFAAPPCSTFSVSRFFDAKGTADGGPKPVRSRRHIRGLPVLTAGQQAEVKRANLIVQRTCALLDLAFQSGVDFVLENPADRGNPMLARDFLHADHGPLWLMEEIQTLRQRAHARLVTFPMCAFGAPWQKKTSLLFTAGIESWMVPLGNLACEHSTHRRIAGGTKGDTGAWESAEAAAYPPAFNYYVARAIAALSAQTAASPSPSPTSAEPPRPSAPARAVYEPIAAAEATEDPPSADPLDPLAAGRQPGGAPSESPVSPPLPESPSPASPSPDSPAAKPRRQKKEPFQRGLGRIPTRASALFSRSSTRRAMLAAFTAFAPGMQPVTQPDPQHRSQALKQDAVEWPASERKEIANHESNESWRVVPRSSLPAGRTTVKLVWAYKNKRSGARKSRLCVQGCAQVAGVDYDQTFSPAMRPTSMRLLSSLAARHGMRMRRWDFVAAYLQGELLEGEVVYCTPPTGYRFDASGKLVAGKDDGERICVVQKPIYGMAQAGRRWQRTLFPWLTDELKFKQLHADPCLFEIKSTRNTPDGPREERLILGCYVDDLQVLYSHDDEHSLYAWFVESLQARWEVEDEGDLTDLLNVEFSFTEHGVCLRQTGYIEKMARSFFPDGVPTGKCYRVPCDQALPQLVADALTQSAEDVSPSLLKQYQSIVGSLLYCSVQTRPDVAYAVGMLCRAMGKPTAELHLAALHVLCYLYRTRELGLRYSPDQRDVSGMSDADWAVKHSTTGYVFMFNSAAISWSSQKQKSISLSSCEAEIMAASEAAREAVYLDGFSEELGAPLSGPLSLSVDNTGARDLAYNPEHHARSKHIERRHFFIREMVENMRIQVPYVNTVDNLADFFTKPLPARVFVPMRDTIMNYPAAAGEGSDD